MKPLELSHPLAISGAATPNEVLAKMSQEGHALALVTGERSVLSVVTAQQLGSLESPNDPLADQLPALPPPVVIDTPVLDAKDIAEVAGMLARGGAAAAVVLDRDEIQGVVTVRTIAAMLSLEVTVAERLVGTPNVPTRTYRCATCGAQRRPRSGSEAPTCPLDWSHGQMQPAEP